jgi:hypothetical protein
MVNGVLALSMTCLLTSSGLHIIIHKFYSNGVLALSMTCLLTSSGLHIIIHKPLLNSKLYTSSICNSPYILQAVWYGSTWPKMVKDYKNSLKRCQQRHGVDRAKAPFAHLNCLKKCVER